MTLAFSGLTPGTKYLGSVASGGTTGLPNRRSFASIRSVKIVDDR
jgi:hypothetical protein